MPWGASKSPLGCSFIIDYTQGYSTQCSWDQDEVPGESVLFCDKLKERPTPGKCLLGRILQGQVQMLLGSAGSLEGDRSLSAETLPGCLSATSHPSFLKGHPLFSEHLSPLMAFFPVFPPQ